MCIRSAAQNQPAIQRSVRVRLQVHKEQPLLLRLKLPLPASFALCDLDRKSGLALTQSSAPARPVSRTQQPFAGWRDTRTPLAIYKLRA